MSDSFSDRGNLSHSVAPLANASRLLALVDRCLNRAQGLPGMGTFYGRAGLGKTTAGICATNSMNAVHIEALPFGGVKTLLGMIVREMDIVPARTVPMMFEQAAEALARSGRPLIIDEADSILKDTLIETVRRLHDVTGVPLVLMGEELLPQKLTRWERVHGRMLSWVGAEPATAEDVVHLARIYAPGIVIDEDLQARVLLVSRGSIRIASTNLAYLREFAVTRGLDRIGLREWGATPLHSGVAPDRRYGASAAAPALPRKMSAA